jgi:hypothetical protein
MFTILLQFLKCCGLPQDYLLLALTQGVLFRPFCIAEIYHAIQAGKAIVLVTEEDGRAGFDWDLDKFEAEIARATTDVAGELGRGRASH